MRVRILVADESEARFYDAEGLHAPIKAIGTISDPSARLHDRDLKSDRPGRVVGSTRSGAGGHSAATHHAVGGERSPRKLAAQRFARRIVDELEISLQQHRFDRLVVMASAPFLGTLRAALPKLMRAHLVAEVPKDLVHQTDDAVREHLPAEAFQTLA